MERTQMGGGICQGYLTIAHDFVNFSTHGRAMVEETEGKGAVFRAIFEKKNRDGDRSIILRRRKERPMHRIRDRMIPLEYVGISMRES